MLLIAVHEGGGRGISDHGKLLMCSLGQSITS